MMRTLSIALLTVGDPGRLTGGYLYHRRLAEAAPRHGARLTFLSFPNRPFPLAALDAPVLLRRAHRMSAHVLVLDSIAAVYAGPWMFLRPPSLPLVAMLHQPPGGIDHRPMRVRVQTWLDRLAYARSRRLLVASDSLAHELAAAGLPRERILVVPPGRDVSPVAGPPPGDLRQGRRASFLCVANWVDRKGIHGLLDAFAALPPDAGTLHLAGDNQADPAYAARIRSRIAEPDLRDRVVVHGPLHLDAVAALYGAADVFVLPSLKEPYGTVYGEAMAAGLPVVGWRAGNLPYLAEHEKEGLLAEPGDLAGLTAALQRLASDESLRRRMGQAARERALTRPTWEETATRFFEAVRAVATSWPETASPLNRK